MTLAPPRPDWDLDDAGDGVDDPDDYEFVEPEAVPVEWPFGTPVSPI
jgi:hypothetical protein